jgi:tetratricopeptide (TPR) repeat protein
MWSIWFRAGTPDQNEELHRLVELAASGEADRETLIAGFDQLISLAPEFAEAYHQRAMVHLHHSDLAKTIKDCERALKLNPHHFAAAGCMGQCYLKQRKLKAALRAFRRSFRVNPNREEVQEAILSLEKTLGEEGKR